MELSDQLIAIAKMLRCNFTLKNQPVEPKKVFSPTGLLPAIMKRSEQLSNFCLGHGLGCQFVDSPEAMMGTKVRLDDKTPTSLRVMCATDVLIEMVQNAPSRDQIPLDELMYD